MSGAAPRLHRAASAPLSRLLDSRHPYLILAAYCLLLWLPGFFTIPPTDRDESRFAQATKQMLESGDFVRIRNGDEERNRKPIGIYWLQAPFAAVAPGAGLARANPIWPYRIPSLLGGLVAVWATFGLGRRLVGRRAALLGAAMLAGSLVLVVETHLAKTDAALLAATTLAMGLLARAYLDPGGFAARHAAAFWLAIGAAVLIKGPVAPMIAGLAAASLAVADRPEPAARWLGKLRPLRGSLLLIAVVLPWLVAIGLATHGRFFAEAIGADLGRKLAGGEESHGGPPGLHVLLMPLTMFPAAFIVLASLLAAWRARGEPATRFLIAWVVPAWLVFEAVPTKLPHYTLPLFPALALFAGRWALDPAALAPPAWVRRLALGALLTAAFVVGVGVAVLPAVVEQRAGAVWLGLPALLAAALLVWLVLRSLPDWPRAALASLVAMPLLTASVLGFELPRLDHLWIAPRLAAALAAHWPEGRPSDAEFGTVGLAEPSLRFLCGTEAHLFTDARQGAAFLAQGGPRVVAVENRELGRFMAAADRLGLRPRAFTVVSGFNYSHGRAVELTLFAR